MLREIYIKNFAILKEVRVPFGEGFNVLTGETGAGKSIVVDALNALVGGKVDPVMLSEEETIIEGVLELPPSSPAYAFLEEMGFSVEDIVTITRHFSKGRSSARIMGRMVPLQLLSELGSLLVDIHGQHQHQMLLNPLSHLEMLDKWDKKVWQQREKVGFLFSELTKRRKRYKELEEKARERERLLSLYDFQIKEIKEANPYPGEEEELQKEALFLSNVERIFQNLSLALSLLKEGEPSAKDLIGKAGRLLEEVAPFDEEIRNASTALKDVSSLLEEVSHSLSLILARTDFDPHRLEEVQSRLYLLSQLKKKYGSTIEEVLAYKEKLERERELLLESGEVLEELEGEIKELEGELEREARVLSQMRQEVAGVLERTVVSHLRDLGMEKANFKVAFYPKGVDGKGMEEVEFLFTANPGEPLHPLHKVASGGELSRFMLAMKSALREVDPLPILVFDEIDQGVSGRLGFALGEKLLELSEGKQVIVVTHLPQIACFAEHHLLVRKVERNGGVDVEIKPLSEEERVEELARMLGGVESTTVARQHAFELLERFGRRGR